MSVFKRADRPGDSRWWILYKTASGKWRKEPVGTSHKLAKEVEAKRIAEAAEGKHFPERCTGALSFNSVLDKVWLLHLRDLKSRSWTNYLQHFRTRFGRMRIGDITPADVKQFYQETKQRTSISTANRYLTCLRLIFNKAEFFGLYYGRNPTRGLKKEKEPNYRTRFLSLDEMARLLNVAHPRLCPVIAVSLLTGMRRGEVLGLQWEHVDLEHRVIHVLKSKSGKPRIIPISAKLAGVLMSLGPKPEGVVFDLPVITLRRLFVRALKDAYIFGFRWHDLRHSFASHHAMTNRDPAALQAILGHSTPMLTARYTHLSNEHQANGMDALAEKMPIKPSALLLPILPESDGEEPCTNPT